MPAAKALRHIPELCGKAYEPGAPIPAAVIGKISPQVLRVLVDQHAIEVDGMEASGKGAGSMTHVTARLDAHSDRLKGVDKTTGEILKTLSSIEKRLAALEAKPTKAAKAAAKDK